MRKRSLFVSTLFMLAFLSVIGVNAIAADLSSSLFNGDRLESNAFEDAREPFATVTNPIPKDLVRMTASLPYAIVVDVAVSTLYLFANEQGVPRLVEHFYISSGKAGADKVVEGDNKTPIGVYFITSRISDERLAARYGVGALPLNYPNEWDSLANKTGSGIWIHGSLNNDQRRPPQDSEGCIVLNNVDFNKLNQRVDIQSTPVIIGSTIEWLAPEQWLAQQQHFVQLLKAQVSTVEKLSLFTYPNDKGVLVAAYDPVIAEKTNHNRQYWYKDQQHWKVVNAPGSTVLAIDNAINTISTSVTAQGAY